MISSSGYRAHSADVVMGLLIEGSSLRIAQMGPDFLMVDSDAAHAPGLATILMRVDASERQWEVYLPQGIAAAGMQEVIITLPPGQSLRQEKSRQVPTKR